MTTHYTTRDERFAQTQAEIDAAEGVQMDSQVPEGTQPVQQENSREEEVNWEKRYKDLQSYHDRTMAQVREQGADAQFFETENEKLKRQVGELAADLEARKVREAVELARQQVAAKHPDYEQLLRGDEFKAWIQRQPQAYQDAIYADIPDASLACHAITLFKVDAGLLNKREEPAKNTDAAMAVNHGQRGAPQELDGPKIWSMREIERMHPNEYAKHEAEIDKAIAEGRIKP